LAVACTAYTQDFIQGSGQVQRPDAATTVVRQTTDRAVVQWASLSIDAGHTLEFVQPSCTSVILNRVNGADPSVIQGALKANGQVWLLNPNGILFTSSARVDVGGLVASTLSLSDADFLSGQWTLSQDPARSLAAIVNQGEIRGGTIILAAPLVENSGVIRGGAIHLLGGRQVMLDDGLIHVSLGSVNDRGTVVMTSVSDVMRQVVNSRGLVEAGEVIEEGGLVKLVGAEGVVVNSGTIAANGSDHRNAGRVALNSTQATVTTRHSVIEADGVGMNSNGGTIRIVSNGTALFAGAASARGGTTGDGGFIEVSAKGKIHLFGTGDTTASGGRAGLFYLDPDFIEIIPNWMGGGDADGELPTLEWFEGNFPNSTVGQSALESLSGSTNILIEATSSIQIDDMAGGQLNFATTAGFTVTFRTTFAGSDISFNNTSNTVRTNGGNIVFTAYNMNIGGLASNGGSITLT
jgi:filamentous hemagglutinin family protein